MMHGPGRRGQPMAPMSMKGQGKILKRLMGIVFKRYAVQFALVVVCILVTALCTLQGTLFTQTLIDDYILPLVEVAKAGGAPDFAPLAQALTRLAIILVIGIACSYGYNRIMVNVSQGTMLNIRTSLFTHMQSLPIKYFDTHAHGDIMSVYTNDVDTMRMLIGNTIPQVINSAITIVITFYSMITLS